MRGFWLKVMATLLTMGATVASAMYVSAHLKNPAAPLQPVVLNDASGVSGYPFGAPFGASPRVEPSSGEPMASTYAS